jgi:hypothetical protein
MKQTLLLVLDRETRAHIASVLAADGAHDVDHSEPSTP